MHEGERETAREPPRCIPHSCPSIADRDVMAVAERMRTRQIAAGSLVRELESRWAEHLGVDRETVLMVASGTFAIYIALRLSDVGAGDLVLMPAFACRAIADAATEVGASPLVVDVGPRYGIDDGAALQRAKEAGNPGAVIAVHPFGARLDLERLEALRCPIIEDCAHAPELRPSPSAAVSVYSFQATKLLAAGEGGAVVASSREARARLELLRAGIDRHGSAVGRLLVPMSDLTAALSLSQLEQWPVFRERRRALAQLYKTLLGPHFDHHLWFDDDVPHRWLLRTHARFRELQGEMSRMGIAIRRPVDPLLHHLFDREATCPRADDLYDTTISLPLYPSLEDEDVRRIAEGFLATAAKSSQAYVRAETVTR